MLWREGTMVAVHSHGSASALGVKWVTSFSARDYELNSTGMTVVTFTSQDGVVVLRRRFSFQVMQQTIQDVLSMSVGQHSVLWWCAGEAAPRRGRQAGLTYWWKRLPLLCGWTWTAWRHRQREDDDQTEFRLGTTPPTLLRTDAATPLSASTIFPARCLTGHLWVLFCAISAPSSSFQSQLTTWHRIYKLFCTAFVGLSACCTYLQCT